MIHLFACVFFLLWNAVFTSLSDKHQNEARVRWWLFSELPRFLAYPDVVTILGNDGYAHYGPDFQHVLSSKMATHEDVMEFLEKVDAVCCAPCPGPRYAAAYGLNIVVECGGVPYVLSVNPRIIDGRGGPPMSINEFFHLIERTIKQ